MKNVSAIGFKIIVVLSAIVGLWSMVALVSGCIATGGIAPLVGSWMGAVGLIQPIHTLVDFYTHIKGIEYIICVAFFVVFPVFFKYVNKERIDTKNFA